MQHVINSKAIIKASTVSFVALALYIVFISVAQAQVGDVLCAVWWIIYNDVGRGIGTLAVAILGIGATMGKVSWGLAITVGVGIAVMFSADIVYWSLGVGETTC